MPPAPPARRTPKATPPADDATVVVTFKGRKNCADTSVPITLVKHKEKWASHAYCPEELRGKRGSRPTSPGPPKKLPAGAHANVKKRAPRSAPSRPTARVCKGSAVNKSNL